MKVMVFGSFDSLHEGHRSLFEQAKTYGNTLIVVLARDDSIRRIKHREPRAREQERREAVQREPLVDMAVLGDKEDFLAVIAEHSPDVLVLGYDQTTIDSQILEEKLTERGFSPLIVRAKAHQPHKYKSSNLAQANR